MEPAALEQMLQHTNQLSELTFNLRISDFIPYNQIVYYVYSFENSLRNALITKFVNRLSCVWKCRFNEIHASHQGADSVDFQATRKFSFK